QALGDQVKSFFGIASNASDGLDDIARGADAAAASANNAKTAMVGLSGAGSAFIVIGAAVAAAGVALALAYEKGSSEADELNKAIVLTGNYAGTTAGQLSAMAASLARANGTQYEAVAVLSEITATGKFTVDQIEQVATTSIAMQEATGKAVSDTVAEFSKLADEPVKASQQLNEKYHYLTASVYEQIAALDQQGDSLGAAQLAMDAYSQAMDERASQIVENLGTLETAWKTVAGVAKGAWDEMLGVGRTETPEERLEQLTKGQAFQPGRAVASGAVFGPLGWFNELRKAYQRSSMSDDERGRQFTDAL
ncbi:phage tail length tape measure family protein, partial [Pseudomonas aeruginosa]|nr:phage tail length tape measure family protein [Pseudomonas aeruginosa]HCK4822132.1 phage tail length tape measure family protein [Pseudomonas aeruginosa]